MSYQDYITRRKPVRGIGINDANYATTKMIDGKNVRCPFYRTWTNMLGRCYDPKFHAKRQTYIGCTVAPEWLSFMAFRSWMTAQDWSGKQLDKDVVQPGNKIYSPETCVFVSPQINQLLVDSAAARGNFPQGVCLFKLDGKFQAGIKLFGKQKYLGRFDTQEEASKAYLLAKYDHILRIASGETDIRIKQGLARHAKLLEKKQ